MSNQSDHNKPAIDITKLLPEVYHSEVGDAVLNTAFNRHLTKDDTSRVAGFVGTANPSALVDRQIKEADVHRQAFQLAPTMVSTVGTQTNTLSFKAFMRQLALMGVDTNRIDDWGSTQQFNWAPPVNIDMLVNYQDYFWKPSGTNDSPQYFTVENRCNKAQSRVDSYQQVLNTRGESFTVASISFDTNTLWVSGRYDDVFSTGFTFYTKDSNNINFRNTFWTVESSTYDLTTNTTAIVVLEPFATISETLPSTPRVDQFWYVASTKQLYKWTGSSWVLAPQTYNITISLAEQLSVYQAEANCICNQASGWDSSAWDDNTTTPGSWTTAWLQGITFNTAAQWVAANGQPINGSQWYKGQTDELLTYSTKTAGWEPAQLGLTQLITRLSGTTLWDMTQGCESQHATQWSANNKWIHKSQVQSYADVRRAQLPILEYSSRAELNEWSNFNYSWKYRASPDELFTTASTGPTRLELEPIKGYVAVSMNGSWYIYLSSSTNQMDVDIDYTNIFVPGYKFRITDDSLASTIYTVDSSEYRQIAPVESAYSALVGVYVTVIKLKETVFTSSTLGGGTSHIRIEPLRTSQGDGWRGYHAHWVLNETATTTTAAGNVPINPRLQASLDSTIIPVSTSSLPVHFDTGVAFQPANLLIEVGDLHQLVHVGTTSISRVDLLDKFRYNAGAAGVFATPGTNELRVYVNGVQQRNTYTEITGIGTHNVTVVGNTAITNPVSIEYVQAIEFNTPLNPLDEVRIEVGAAAMSQMGWTHVPVRTIEDEALFALGVSNGTQPSYQSMTSVRRIEQVKTLANQYPLFNAYDVVTGEVVSANPLFAFREDASFFVNAAVERRISTSTDGKEYEFEQFLVESDNGQIYGYRTGPYTVSYWFNPSTAKLKIWNNGGWSEKFPISIAANVVSFKAPIVSETAPALAEGTIWYQASTNTLRVRSNDVWVVTPGVTVSSSDPTLVTIWRTDTTSTYVPQYVDKNGDAVAKGSTDGDWGVVDQWRYNPQHENRRTVKYSEVVTHFSTLLNNQDKVPGLLNGGIYTMMQEDYNFSRGGTIKEHNHSFDTLISAVNVTNVTPIGVVDFACEEYATNLLSMREAFTKQAVSLFASHSQASLINLADYVATSIISTHEANDFIAQIYGDSHAYDGTTKKGVKNWIATAPMLGLAPKYRPHLNVFDNQVQLFHHDGHRSVITYPVSEQDRYSRQLCDTVDTRGGLVGKVSTTPPPNTYSNFNQQYGFDPRPGAYWYRVGGGVRQLYRLSVLSVSANPPSLYDVDGAEIPNETLYYNFGTNIVFRKVGLAWVQASSTPGDISMLWEPINFIEIVGNLFLTLEQRLYDVTPDVDAVYDFSQLYATSTSAALYDATMRKRFDSYIAKTGTSTPFINTTYVASNAFTWNYTSSTATTPPTTKAARQLACWQAVYNHWYGTPYPHVEPWKLQGYRDKPTWWDAEYLDLTGTRRWIYTHATKSGMWENIRVGRVPAGRTYPNGVVSTGDAVVDGVITPKYLYFSVNISDDTLVGGYAPDALLPPYFDNSAIVGALPTVRSIYNNFTSEIGVVDADYAYGDIGPAEWTWLTSSQHPYDNAAAAFILQPAKFLHAAFGPTFVTVGGLQVETTLKQVYSCQDALFHGDVYNTDQAYTVRGINQWYVNYNRYSGFDTNGEFRTLWAGWNPKLTYQFGGIVDTSTVEISSKYYDMIPQDYSIILANNGVIRDVWIDAFEATLLNIPSAIAQYNNQSQWKIELDSLAANDRTIEYYGVKQYAFTVDPVTNICSVFQYNIIAASTAARCFTVSGDETSTFVKDSTIMIAGSQTNNGAYTVSSSVFESSSNTTRINVVEPIAGSVSGGTIQISTKSLPWQTGDEVVITSSKIAPAPLYSDTTYFIIRLSDSTFQLADTKSDAYAGIVVDITSSGDGVQYIAEIESSFHVFGGVSNSGELWHHFALDSNDVRTFTPPYTVVGMQSFINIIDGYAARQRSLGLLQNIADVQYLDPETGRAIDWSLETERFINWAYGLRQSRISLSNSHPVAIDLMNDTMTFTSSYPAWSSGTMVAITSTGALPTPLQPNVPYFIIKTNDSPAFKLSMSNDASDLESYIDLTSVGSGTVSVSTYERRSTYPKFELNPTRYNAWIDTPLGVLSDVITGPYLDIRVQQTVFDQYSRPLSPSQLVVYREDKRSHIAIRRGMLNDVDPSHGSDDYNNIHLGGGHLFLESYEHFLVLNNYTVGGALVYDPFLGIQARKFNLDYFEKQDYTLRPTLGGYYLLDGKFYRNMEGSTTDAKNYYDTLALSESTDVAHRARSILGYRGRQTFLDLLNINSKSQFLFYKGMIQTKGSVNSVNAFINSRRFVDAKVDEFWAWKVASYGDSRTKIYPEIKLFTADSLLDDVRLNFLGDGELVSDDASVTAAANGFQMVSFGDSSRWSLSPEQQKRIQSPLFLDATVTTLQTIYSSPTHPHPGMEKTVDIWFDTVNDKAYTYDLPTGLWSKQTTSGAVQSDTIVVDGITTPVVYVKLNQACDAIRVLRRTAAQQTFNIISCTNDTITVQGNVTDTLTVGVPFLVRNANVVAVWDAPEVSDDADGAWDAAVITDIGDEVVNGWQPAFFSQTNEGGGDSGLVSNDDTYEPYNVYFDGTNTIIRVRLSTPTGALPVIMEDTVGGNIIIQDFNHYTTEAYTEGNIASGYVRINTEVARFQLAGFSDIVMIYLANPAASRISPAKLIDGKANTVVQQLPLWDPARGHHSPTAAYNIDLLADTDPARYSSTVNPENSTQNYWNATEVGTTWMDTSSLGYVPYYDDQVYPSVNDRLYSWGKLAPWSSVNVYKWTEATVPPSGWDELVTKQASNATIAQADKATGTPRKTTFKRVRQSHAVSVVNVSNSTITVPGHVFEDGQQVLFTTAGVVPAGLVANTKYSVSGNGNTISLIDPTNDEAIILTDVGVGALYAVPAFNAADWRSQHLQHERICAYQTAYNSRLLANTHTTAFGWPLTTSRIAWVPANPELWVVGVTAESDRVSVYVNSVLIASDLLINTTEVNGVVYFYVDMPSTHNLREQDLVDIVRPIHTITDTEAAFNPDVEDDGTVMIQWKTDYQYSTTVKYTGSTATTQYYYWIGGSTNKTSTKPSSLSAYEIANQIVTIPTAYFVVQRPADSSSTSHDFGYGSSKYGATYGPAMSDTQLFDTNVMYRQAIIRKVSSYLTDDDRYFVRFTRDLTLRNDLRDNGRNMNLKNVHDEWVMFRRNQIDTIPRKLWDRLTESLMGYKLTDNTVRVPSLEYELYDALSGTDTRYGLGDNQTFVNGDIGLATVLAYLHDPTNDFAPMDINAFFAQYSFDTPENIKLAMDAIYLRFNSKHVNAIWFETLMDALASKSKYRELMKTSWVALHGIRVLEVGGLFDD